MFESIFLHANQKICFCIFICVPAYLNIVHKFILSRYFKKRTQILNQRDFTQKFGLHLKTCVHVKILYVKFFIADLTLITFKTYFIHGLLANGPSSIGNETLNHSSTSSSMYFLFSSCFAGCIIFFILSLTSLSFVLIFDFFR